MVCVEAGMIQVDREGGASALKAHGRREQKERLAPKATDPDLPEGTAAPSDDQASLSAGDRRLYASSTSRLVPGRGQFGAIFGQAGIS